MIAEDERKKRWALTADMRYYKPNHSPGICDYCDEQWKRINAAWTPRLGEKGTINGEAVTVRRIDKFMGIAQSDVDGREISFFHKEFVSEDRWQFRN